MRKLATYTHVSKLIKNASQPAVSTCVISMGYDAPEHCNPESSPIGVTQPLVLGVHQLKNCVIVQNTVRLDRSRELREFLSAERTLVIRLRTFI